MDFTTMNGGGGWRKGGGRGVGEQRGLGKVGEEEEEARGRGAQVK